MATGPATSWKFEVQWDGTTWVDESAYLLADESNAVRITRGRASEADDLQPGVLTGVLDNTSGRFTPDNPLSPLYPNVKDGVRTRFSVTKSATTWSRHQGRLAAGEPTLADGSTATSIVPFQSVGLLGELSGRMLRCDFVERWLNRAETKTVDLFPFEGTAVTNIGDGGGTARIAASKSGQGTWEIGTPDGIQLDSQITLTASGSSCPSVRLTLSQAFATAGANMIVIPFRTASRTPTSPAGNSLLIARGYGAGGAQEWALKLKDNATQCDLNLYDASDAFVVTLYGGFSVIGADQGDDQWFSLLLFDNAGTVQYILRRHIDGAIIANNTTIAFSSNATASIVLGGETSVTFGAVAVSDHDGSGYDNYLPVNAREGAQARATDLSLYADYTQTLNGSRSAEVWLKQLSGRSAFEVVSELCRTVGATVTENQAAYSLDFRDSDTRRLPTVAVNVDMEADATAEFAWRKGDVPSQVTATWPGGQVTVTDSTRPRVDEMLDTCAADETSARDVASARVNSSRRLRLTRLVVDLAGSANDLWADMMAAEIGDRVRVNLGADDSLLVTQFGHLFVDVYAAGWTETYWQGGALFELDTIPADDPIEGEFDSADRGRFCANGTMTVTGGTAVGGVGTAGTVIITTSSGPTLTTDSAAYPLDLNWNGEIRTVNSPPASSVSPQTVTLVAGSVAPTVARVHVVGEPIDVAQPAFTF